MFRKILVANRGEIACRVLRTCRRLGIQTVAISSDVDTQSPHARDADEVVPIGPAPVRDSYLSTNKVLHAAKKTGAEAIHPGYGLLSENAAFARAVAEQGLAFIGPTPRVLEALGDKLRARSVAQSVGVASLPGTTTCVDLESMDWAAAEAERIGYPVLVKAVGGGGGIGMQVVRDAPSLARAVKTCSDRGRSAFGDSRVYLERCVEYARHIEVQVLCDSHGDAIVLGERECSVQRRHQKIVEESPTPAWFFQGEEGAGRRRELWDSALRVVREVGYTNAGTVEFLADGEGNLFFMEVNARLQVEHPVTEMTTGLDLVELQLRVACGERVVAGLGATQSQGHAVEARVYAENPDKGFVPQPGRIVELTWPATSDLVRIDTGVEAGSEVSPYYDPMIAKVIAHGVDRSSAVRKLARAMGEINIVLMGSKGPAATNVGLLRKVLDSPRFGAGDYDTRLVDEIMTQTAGLAPG